MHRHVLAVAAATLGLLSAGAALAQPAPTDVTGDVGIGGVVTPRCGFNSTDVTINIGEMSFTSGPSASIAKFNPTTLNSRSTTLNGFCTGANATMTVQAHPMLNTSFVGAPPSGFDDRVDFTATATEGVVSASASSTSGSPGAPSTVGVFANDIVVSFSNSATPGGGRLIAGPYTGSVDVVLTPAS
jgi:hypothetical protein